MAATKKPVLWTYDAPCNTCGFAARAHDSEGRAEDVGCPGYQPASCQGTDDLHGGPVRTRLDGVERCWRHEEARFE